MTFTKACFIRKNTPELRNKLKELGYEPSEGAFNRCSACVEIMANDDNGVSMMNYIDYEDIIGVELIKN